MAFVQIGCPETIKCKTILDHYHVINRIVVNSSINMMYRLRWIWDYFPFVWNYISLFSFWKKKKENEVKPEIYLCAWNQVQPFISVTCTSFVCKYPNERAHFSLYYTALNTMKATATRLRWCCVTVFVTANNTKRKVRARLDVYWQGMWISAEIRAFTYFKTHE